jgi:hypothetical protein
MPEVLYHFTSLEGAAGIATTGGIEAGSGLYGTDGTGVYLTGFNSSIISTIQGAASARKPKAPRLPENLPAPEQRVSRRAASNLSLA